MRQEPILLNSRRHSLFLYLTFLFSHPGKPLHAQDPKYSDWPIPIIVGWRQGRILRRRRRRHRYRYRCPFHRYRIFFLPGSLSLSVPASGAASASASASSVGDFVTAVSEVGKKFSNLSGILMTHWMSMAQFFKYFCLTIWLGQTDATTLKTAV